jgi:hypothetical protein
MKPLWLVETGVWHDGNVDRLLALLREQGVAAHAEQYTHLGGMEFEGADVDRPVVFYGSLNTAEHLRSRIDAVPLVWYDRHAFSCRSYYARWGRLLLQEHYAFYPLAELPRLKGAIYRDFGRDGLVFIRPDDNDKSFGGRLVPEDGFAAWYDEAQINRPDPAALAVVSSPARIDAEWRFVIADGEVIAGSAYKGGDRLGRPDDAHREAVRFAGEVAAEPWQPRPIYVADVAFAAGRCRLVEIGGVNSAGLYRCDLRAVVAAMNAIAERDFRAWKGKP